MDHNNILGTVLAGGKSQRFGEDKSQVKLAGKSLIDHMLTEIIDEFKISNMIKIFINLCLSKFLFEIKNETIKAPRPKIIKKTFERSGKIIKIINT